MKKNKKITAAFIILAILTALSSYFMLPSKGMAAENGEDNYTLLAPIPLGDSVSNQTEEVNFEKYLGGLFKLAIAAAGVLAVFMIVWGGFTYVTTDSFTGKSEGRSYITNALLGLALALLSWLFLYTINPDLVRLKLVFPDKPASGNPPSFIGRPIDSGSITNNPAPVYNVTPVRPVGPVPH